MRMTPRDAMLALALTASSSFVYMSSRSHFQVCIHRCEYVHTNLSEDKSLSIVTIFYASCLNMQA